MHDEPFEEDYFDAAFETEGFDDEVIRGVNLGRHSENVLYSLQKARSYLSEIQQTRPKEEDIREDDDPTQIYEGHNLIRDALIRINKAITIFMDASTD